MKRTFYIIAALLLIVLLVTPGFSQQDDKGREIIKQGIVGAGVGAISAGASGGKAGKGALIGAGTNILGNAILDTFMTPSQPIGTQGTTTSLFEEGYRQGYKDGYSTGYQEGARAK